MNCIRAQHQFVSYLHGELEPQDNAAMLNHVAECSDCRGKLEFERLLQDSLRSLPVPGPSAGFEDRVFAGLDKVEVNKRPVRRTWLAGALAASLAFGVTFGLMTFQAPRDEAAVAQIELAVDEVKTVKLRFNAPRQFEQVTLSLQLPEHMELQGFPGERELSWKTSLEAGVNELNLPVIARKPVDGTIVAKISGKAKTKQFKIYMRAKQTQGHLDLPEATI